MLKGLSAIPYWQLQRWPEHDERYYFQFFWKNTTDSKHLFPLFCRRSSGALLSTISFSLKHSNYNYFESGELKDEYPLKK